MTNEKVFEAMIKEYNTILLKICRVYSNSEDFDDLYQEILINLWKSYPTFKERAKLSTWLYRVALNTGLTYQRNHKKLKKRLEAKQLASTMNATDNSDKKEKEVKWLNQAISQLKKNDRAIILLYLEENSYEEIAEITGISISNVGVKINRIKKKLFSILKQADHG